MVETKFKVLVYAHAYIDENQLDHGIYSTDKPKLYSKETTIESLAKQAKEVAETIGDNFFNENFFKNLNLCELKEVSLVGEI